MGNTSQTMRNQQDNSTYIWTDIIKLVDKKDRFSIPVFGDELFKCPSVSDRLWNWLSSKPTHEFSFDHYSSNSQAESFGNEIQRIVTGMAVTEEEAQRIVSLIIDDLEVALQNQNVPRIWRCYGSYHDGLCCKNSDIDLYYSLKGERYDDGFFKEIGKALGLVESNQSNTETVPKRMEQLLRQSPLFAKVCYIQTAKIPIIKLYHLATKKNVDITCNLTSIMNTELMKFYVFSNRNVKYLTLFLRKLLTKHDLHGTNRITTTILFWLVVYFMQRMISLPSVYDVRNMRGLNKKCYDSGWDYSVPHVEISNSTPHSGQLSLLLLNFFKFYRDYNFSRTVICPLVGYGIPIREFKNLRLEHRGFSVYLKKLQNGEIDCFPVSYINLQDPTILCNNLAKQTNEKTINQFKILCYYAYEGLSKLILSPRTEYQSFKYDNFLPINCLYSDFSDRWHNNLIQYFTLSLKFYKYPQTDRLKSCKLYILSAIFSVMMGIFNFQCDFCVPMNGDRKHKLNDDTSWTYLEYSANYDTWNNSFIRRIYRLIDIPKNINITQQPISIYMLCEINESQKKMKIVLQSEFHIHTFLKSNFGKILESVLNKFDIHVEGVPRMY